MSMPMVTKYKDAATLSFFRVAFGILMLYSMLRYVAKGWVDSVYIQPIFHFKYYGFSWIPELGSWTYLLFVIAGISALMIALGWYYRIAAILFFLSFTYIELLEKTTYLNHYYFVSVVSFIMIFLPANNVFSLDAWRKGQNTDLVEAWTVNSLKILISIVYFCAGLTKLNSDWLLEAQPLSIWLRSKYDLPLIGSNWMQETWFHYAMSWGGAAYDLIIPFLLWNKRSQKFAFVLVIFFHVFTRILFPIGVFPYVMIVASLVFFPGSWHRKVLRLPKLVLDRSYMQIPKYKIAQIVVSVVLLVQVLLPWRYLAYPGELFWTEEGYRFSWRVMLMEKSGYTNFKIVSPENKQSFTVNNEDFLTSYQIKQMSFQPDMILEYAHYLGDYYKQQGIEDVQVYAESYVSLNGRRSQSFVDPKVDLYRQKESFLHKTWILPFNDEINGL